MAGFDLNNFLGNLEQDTKKKEKGNGIYLKRIMMNFQDNQGVINFVPFIPKATQSVYAKIPRVREVWLDNTTLIDKGKGWARILPKEYYTDLTPSEEELFNQVTGLFDQCSEHEAFSWHEGKYRNYSVFFGDVTSMTNAAGASIGKDFIGQPCMIVYPSLAPIDALNAYIAAKKTTLKDKTIQWLSNILSPSNTGRKGIMQINFVKKAGPGYDSSVSMECNSEYSQVVDPEKVWDEDFTSKFEDYVIELTGWCSGRADGRLFNGVAFQEMKKTLEARLAELQAMPKTEAPKEEEAPKAETPEAPKPETTPSAGSFEAPF